MIKKLKILLPLGTLIMITTIISCGTNKKVAKKDSNIIIQQGEKLTPSEIKKRIIENLESRIYALTSMRNQEIYKYEIDAYKNVIKEIKKNSIFSSEIIQYYHKNGQITRVTLLELFTKRLEKELEKEIG